MWTAIAAMVALGAGSWLFRAGFIVFPAGRSLAVALDPWLTHARPAVLAALVASISVRQATEPEFDVLAYAGGLIVAGIVGGATRNLAYAFIAGITAVVLVGQISA